MAVLTASWSVVGWAATVAVPAKETRPTENDVGQLVDELRRRIDRRLRGGWA